MLGLTRLKTCTVAVALALATWVGAAQASTVSATCGDDTRSYSLSSDDSAVTSLGCYATGTIPNFWDPALHASLTADGYSYTGTVANRGRTGDNSDFTDMFSLLHGAGGAFDIADAVDVVLLFEMRPSYCDGAFCEPIYAAFSVTTTAAALLEWSVSAAGRGLGHVTIYSKVAPVPLPAAGLLLLGGLGALGAAKRRRQKV
jgi:hypothetical protein